MTAYVPTTSAAWVSVYKAWKIPAREGRTPRTLSLTGLTVTFEDDFDAVDTTIVDAVSGINDPSVPVGAKWFAPGRTSVGGATHQLKSHTPATIFQGAASELVLRINNEAGFGGGGPWSSAHIQTAKKTGNATFAGFSQCYGVYRMRAKLPPFIGTGNNFCWPAFWILSTSEYVATWLARFEFDVTETYGDNTSEIVRAHSTMFIHPAVFLQPGGSSGNLITGIDLTSSYNGIITMTAYPTLYLNPNQYDGEFHTWAMEWNPTEVIMYYDDVEVCALNIAAIPEFHYPGYVLVSNQLLDDKALTTTRSPMDMTIDYVRVWQKAAWAAAIPDLDLVPPASPTPQIGVDVPKIEGYLAEKWGIGLVSNHPYTTGVNGHPPPMSAAKLTFSQAPTPPNGTVLGTVAPLNMPLSSVTAVYEGSSVMSFNPTTGVLSIPNGAILNQTVFTNHDGTVTFTRGGQSTVTMVRLIARPTDLWLPVDAGAALVFWGDAQDAASMTQSGGLVSQWRDKSITQKHLFSSDARRPQYSATAFNGRPALVFSASSIIRMIWLQNVLPVTRPIGGIIVGLRQFVNNVGTNGHNTVFSGYDGTSPHLYAMTYTPGLINSYVNGTLQGKTSTDVTGLDASGAIFAACTSTGPGDGFDYLMYISVGGGREDAVGNATESGDHAYDGHISEFIMLEGPVSLSTIQKMQGYQAHHWGLQSELPSDHPYKASPPLYV